MNKNFRAVDSGDYGDKKMLSEHTESTFDCLTLLKL